MADHVSDDEFLDTIMKVYKEVGMDRIKSQQNEIMKYQGKREHLLDELEKGVRMLRAHMTIRLCETKTHEENDKLRQKWTKDAEEFRNSDFSIRPFALV